ncbi:hypothetical protein CPB84DRAFT_1794359 [Gymnopilus junonius]|uniref:Molybdate-anion transporter n=1 Tax=Gymnopilus junonius TaxID=109634 RepID=A0A9P5NE19_GYMJU|nr:hypothetical protein CPB84DRAFT_1794359 [Gymnopilus junonius]
MKLTNPNPDSFYESQLILLSVICVFFLVLDRYLERKTRAQQYAAGASLRDRDAADDRLESGKAAGGPVGGALGGAHAMKTLTRQYLVVYAIVMGADWLQGPYVYSLYREQYQFPERLVAVLFVTGFVSAGLAAPLVGVWADQHGRRKLCLVFCITYTLACLCISVPSLPILLVGRFLGGTSTSILFSAFESWLISSGTSLGLPPADLSTIMGRATLVNGVVATAAGVLSNQLVKRTGGNFVAPFGASAVLLVVAWVVIKLTWTENYGAGGGSGAGAGTGTATQVEQDVFQVKRLGKAWNIVRQDPLLLVLGLTQTCFEGSMYLFVFLWVPSLQEHARTPASLPLGYIFSSFMISMMLGSLCYTAIVSYHQRKSSAKAPSGHTTTTTASSPMSTYDSSLTLHAKLSSLVCATSALALAMSVARQEEHVRFWAFCLFEACVGMYYPVQGTLRGTLISNEHRATLSSLFRVPLNIFVVVSLLTGVSSARRAVLTASALMLGLSSLMTGAVIVDRAEEVGVVGGGGQNVNSKALE